MSVLLPPSLSSSHPEWGDNLDVFIVEVHRAVIKNDGRHFH